MALNLNGKTAIITGAGSGIGRACAKLFSELGAEVALIGRNVEALHQTKQECDLNNKKHLVIGADITDEELCKNAVKRVIQAFGKLDVLVNNAGVGELGSIEVTSLAQYDRVMDINVRAAYHMSMLCVPHLIATKGNIVNVSSVCGTRAFPGLLSYCVSKSALDQLTKCTALELAPKGVRVNSINPGVILTGIHLKAGLSEEEYKKVDMFECRCREIQYNAMQYNKLIKVIWKILL